MRHGKLMDTPMGPGVFCEGEEHVEAAWEARTPAKRDSLARKALNADLDNIDAYILLSYSARSLGERIALLREAVRAGERLWAPCFGEQDFPWWGFVGTRPYMRAMHELALALEEAGDFDEAGTLYRRLLELNPNDNQGARALLVRLLMQVPRVTEVRALVRQYPQDGQLEMVMAELWLALRRKNADMAKLGPPVDERNPYVLTWLAGKPGKKRDQVETSPYGVSMGGEDEALMYVDEFGPIWSRSPETLRKIAAYLDSMQKK